MEAIKWKTMHVQVSEAHQIVPLDFKLPAEIANVRGISLLVNEYTGKARGYLCHAGELSLMFNNRKQHPVHLTAEYHKGLNRKMEPLLLDCDIQANQIITGFYLDHGIIRSETGVFLPYTLSIYLECYPKTK